MIAKLVTHAPTRTEAITAQSDALDAFTIEGIRHNIPFLSALMQHPRWREGRLSTGFIAEEFPGGFHPIAPDPEAANVLAAVAAAIDHVLGERKRRISGQAAGRAVNRERRRAVRLGDGEISLEIMRSDAGASRDAGLQGNGASSVERPLDVLAVEVLGGSGARHVLASSWRPGDPVWHGTIDGEAILVQVRPALNGFDLAHRGIEVRAYVYTESEAAAARLMPLKKAADSGKALRCPMPGLVISVAVAEGQEVKAGDTLAVVEAMKMENVLRAERDGVVKIIKAKPGDSLAVDAVIMEFT
jgi:propionyl-CoA carboxylase alpha chain